MKKQTRNLLGVAGVIATVLGVVGAIPSFLKNELGLALASGLFIVGGIIMLALAFGE